MEEEVCAPQDRPEHDLPAVALGERVETLPKQDGDGREAHAEEAVEGYAERVHVLDYLKVKRPLLLKYAGIFFSC